MTRYLVEGAGTPGMYAALAKNPEDRALALHPLFEKLGGRLEVMYYAVGAARHYIVCELPDPVDPKTVEALFIAAHAGGATTQVSFTPILTSAEMVDALKKVGDLGYRPPSS